MRRSLLALVVIASACLGACGPNDVCRIVAINDPSNRTLRRDMMAMGLGQFCKQMTSRQAPLRLAADQPVIGRFYPQHCTQQQMQNGDLWVQFDGYGYAWTQFSKKVTFTSAATVTYNQDFKCDQDNAVYANFDTRAVSPPDFRVLQIEQPVANLMQNWIAPFADNFGRQMLAGKLGQGFTVIQDTDGNVDFDLGHLPRGQRPSHPYQIHGNSRLTYESLRTEVHAGERDFIGPITIEDGGRALWLGMHLEGVQTADVFVIPKAEAEPSLNLYIQYGAAGPLAYPPRFADVLRYGVEYQRAVPLPPGMYYVVIDNTSSAGQAAPPALPIPFGVADAAAVVNYLVQIGDAP